MKKYGQSHLLAFHSDGADARHELLAPQDEALSLLQPALPKMEKRKKFLFQKRYRKFRVPGALYQVLFYVTAVRQLSLKVFFSTTTLAVKICIRMQALSAREQRWKQAELYFYLRR